MAPPPTPPPPPPETVPTKPPSEANQVKNRKPEPSQLVLRCPRCDSPNTKFCYYNNYSLTQPRHFCKTCRRYWTKGGALRNVPIGGGCRKTKKTKSSSSRLSSCSDYSNPDYPFQYSLFSSPPSSSTSPTLEFHDQLGRIPFSRLVNSSTTSPPVIAYNPSATNSCFDHHMDSAAAGSLVMGSFNYNPLGSGSGSGCGSSSVVLNSQDNICSSSAMNDIVQSSHINLASSIESLSSLNQELHWKLQQQRLAMIFGGGGNLNVVDIENQRVEKEQNPLPISFRNLEISKQEEACCGAVGNSNQTRKSTTTSDINDTYHNQFGYKLPNDQWVFDNSTTSNYYTPNHNSTTTTTPYTNSISDNLISSSSTSSSWKGIQPWTTDLDH